MKKFSTFALVPFLLLAALGVAQNGPFKHIRRASFPLIALGFSLALLLTPASWAAAKYKILHTFTGGKDGGLVASGFTLDTGSNPYGMTFWGGMGADCGDYGCGVIFKLSPHRGGRWNEAVLLDFTGNTGSGGYSTNLLFNSSGNLFGSTVAIDYHSYIFELTPVQGEWAFNPIYYEGGYCLVFDQAGDLYGCIPPGQFGELSPGTDGWTYTDLGGADTCHDGCEPVAPLSWDMQGDLYGTTLFGGNEPPLCLGSAGCGVAFQMTPKGDGTWTYHVLWRFAATRTDGYYPYAGLTVDASGNAYGLTSAGGKYGSGTFFKLTPTKSGLWKENILYEFPNCADGCGPSSTLVADKAGNLYGTGAGGNHCGYDCGTVFKFSPQKDGTWKYSVVHKFNGSDGAFPYGVVLDDKGNIFGTTMQGGKYNLGVAFEITP